MGVRDHVVLCWRQERQGVMFSCFACGRLVDQQSLIVVAGYRGQADGGMRLHPDCAVGLAADVLAAVRTRPARRSTPATLSVHLTHLELSVLEGIVREETNPQIARRLKRSDHTVRNVVSNVLSKLDAASRTGAAVKAVYTGLVVPEV